MKMHLAHRAAVGVALGLGDQGIHRFCLFFDRPWHGQTVDHGLDLGHTGVVVMAMPMAVFVPVFMTIPVFVVMNMFMVMLMGR